MRRHTADAVEITVQVRYDAGRLRVSVTHGGGFGLVGLKVRAVFPARVR
ncbi:hypothetical protein ACWCRD_25760 [Streptomyces sp. NPDC002092]